MVEEVDATVQQHAQVPSKHDGASHWWTLHPRSRAGTFDRYTSLFSSNATLALLRRRPRSLLGEWSQATFTCTHALRVGLS